MSPMSILVLHFQFTWFDYSEKGERQGTFPGSGAPNDADTLPARHFEGQIMKDQVLAFPAITMFDSV